MIDLIKAKSDIPKIMIWMNILFLLISSFFDGKGLLIAALIINLVFSLSIVILNKFGSMAQNILATRKILKNIGGKN